MSTKAKLKAGAAIPAAPKINARGEGTLDLGDRQLTLKLTLAAMNKIEVEYDLESIADIDQVMQRPSAKKLCFLLRALSLEPVTDDDILNSQLAREGDLAEIGRRLGAVLSGQQAEAEAEPGNATAPSA